jgi:hypothetical protein
MTVAYANREDKIANDRARYLRDGAAMRAAALKHHHENRERILEGRKERRKDETKRLRDAEAMRAYHASLRAEMITAYGGRCKCCGEKQPLFLELDHTDNNGHEHRRLIGRSSSAIYRYLKKLGWPQEGYQLFCATWRERKGKKEASPWQRVKPGDRLWVRENWRPDDFAPDDPARTIFMADASDDALRETRGVIRWRPSIHLPRARSRLTLIVSAVKIEPLLDITEEDARAEGFEDGQLNDGFGPQEIGGGCTIESPGSFASAAGMFQVTWANLHPEWDGYSSPDVVCLSFKVVRKNIDAIGIAA